MDRLGYAAVTGVVCARHGARLGGENPLTTFQEEGLAKDKGVAVRRGLKEVRSQARTRRTEIASVLRNRSEQAGPTEPRLLGQASSQAPDLEAVEAAGHAVQESA